MSLSERDIALIDKFIRGKLTGEEAILFDKIKDRVEVKEEINFCQDIIMATTSNKRSDRKNLLQNIEKGDVQAPQGSSFPYIWLWVLIIFGIIAVISWFHSKPDSQPQDTHFAGLVEPYPNIIDPISRGAGQNLSPYQLYEQGDYPSAIAAFSSIDTVSADARFFLGLSHLFNQNPAQSTRFLEPFLKDTSNRYHTAAQWYIVQAYLDQNRKSEAENILSDMVDNEEHPYQAEAAELIISLSK